MLKLNFKNDFMLEKKNKDTYFSKIILKSEVSTRVMQGWRYYAGEGGNAQWRAITQLTRGCVRHRE